MLLYAGDCSNEYHCSDVHDGQVLGSELPTVRFTLVCTLSFSEVLGSVTPLCGVGEVTLTGRVLPIGGLKEKTLAARRSGVNTLLFPQGNKKDWDELAGTCPCSCLAAAKLRN